MMPRAFVVLGAPGSGKGTQCARLAEQYAAEHLSLGALLRAEVQRNTPIGRRVAAHLAAGRLVPDDIALAIVTACLASGTVVRTVLLDGFPRTVRQADLLESRCPGAIKICVELVVPRAVLLHRLRERRRDDDTAEAIGQRLTSYGLERQPLSAWFASRGLLNLVDGNQPPDLVAVSIARAVARVTGRSGSLEAIPA
jgi:adenylate kinase